LLRLFHVQFASNVLFVNVSVDAHVTTSDVASELSTASQSAFHSTKFPDVQAVPVTRFVSEPVTLFNHDTLSESSIVTQLFCIVSHDVQSNLTIALSVEDPGHDTFHPPPACCKLVYHHV
jgi:hypothetical protein